MKRRSSKMITLAVLSAMIVSCTEEAVKKENKPVETTQKAYMRADSTATFTDTSSRVRTEQDNTSSHSNHSHSGMTASDMALMYLMFNNSGHGYSSGSLSHESNVGRNSSKSRHLSSSPTYRSTTRSGSSMSSSKSSSISRGGFGGSSMRSSAS